MDFLHWVGLVGFPLSLMACIVLVVVGARRRARLDYVPRCAGAGLLLWATAFFFLVLTAYPFFMQVAGQRTASLPQGPASGTLEGRLQ